MAEPTTETLSPVAPIAPQPGVVNIFTDADTLSATITGSGWDTIGDMGGLEAQLAEKVDAADLATVATSGSYNDLTDKQCQALLKSPCPLSDVFRAWEKYESSHMEELWSVVDNRANTVIQAEKAKPHREER